MLVAYNDKYRNINNFTAKYEKDKKLKGVFVLV